jgi:hypothetical protein
LACGHRFVERQAARRVHADIGVPLVSGSLAQKLAAGDDPQLHLGSGNGTAESDTQAALVHMASKTHMPDLVRVLRFGLHAHRHISRGLWAGIEAGEFLTGHQPILSRKLNCR